MGKIETIGQQEGSNFTFRRTERFSEVLHRSTNISYQDKRLYRGVDDVSGVGPKTATRIRKAFDAEAFLDACETGFKQRDTEALEDVDGVGGATARRIVSYVADSKDWERPKFALSA